MDQATVNEAVALPDEPAGSQVAAATTELIVVPDLSPPDGGAGLAHAAGADALPPAANGHGWLATRLAAPLRALQHIVYPPLCLACDVDLEDADADFCPACLGEMVDAGGNTCVRCAASVGPFVDTSAGCLQCHRQKHRFDGALRLGLYAGKLREACLALKSSTNELLGRALARLLVRRHSIALSAAAANMVVAVPLHWRRRFRRGFNQAQSLADHVARALQLPHRSRILKRVRRTRPQAGLKRDERLANVRGAFRAKQVSALRGATVVLVDDILTTGATCSEAARALKEAGAARVIVVVVARSQEHAIA